MRRSSYLLLVCFLAAGLIATGCGDDEGGDGSDEPAQENRGDAAAQGTEEDCKRTVRSAPQLSTDVKDELLTACEQAARGDSEAARETIRKVCIRVIEESLPPGPAADQAKEACSQGTQSP